MCKRLTFPDILGLVGFAGIAFDHWGGVLVVAIAVLFLCPKRPAEGKPEEP